MKGLLVAASLLLLAGVASAGEAVPAKSDVAQCLSLTGEGPPTPVYPPELLQRKDGGTVPVELVFKAPDDAPTARILDETAFTPLKDAVLRHVRRYRVPCLKATGAPATLRQDYVFRPNDGRKVVWSTDDEGDEQRAAQAKCLKHLKPGSKPDYPAWARRQELQENYFVRLRFTSADQPPEMTMLAQPRRANLYRAILDFVDGYRLPCFDGTPLELTQLFQYRLEGGSRLVLNDVSLAELLRFAKDVPSAVYFDLGTMACPFDVRLKYFRPHGDNTVSELEQSVPARRPLLQWLSQVTLNLPPDQNLAVLGEEITVAIPCGAINL
jgi:hypothetical protein